MTIPSLHPHALRCAALALVLACSAGCTVRDSHGQVYKPGLANTLTPTATEPANPNPPAPEPRTLAPSPEDEVRLSDLITRARQSILDGAPADAVDNLTEAQTLSGWALTPRASEVTFWLGHAYEQLGERTAAISAYRRTATLYPNTPLGARARVRLAQLRDEPQPAPAADDSDAH